jgi:hypothetical protein
MLNYKITNIVTSGELPFVVDLFEIGKDSNNSYEPELFPGAIISLNKNHIIDKKTKKNKKFLLFPKRKDNTDQVMKFVYAGEVTTEEIEKQITLFEKYCRKFEIKNSSLGNRRIFNFHRSELPILLRRLEEIGTPEAQQWKEDIEHYKDTPVFH